MKIFRKTIVAALENRALNYLAHVANFNALTVLCYHGVIERHLGPEHPQFLTTVHTSELVEHLRMVLRWFTPVTATLVRNWYLGTASLPRHSLLVTFDDGYQNNRTLAAPLLLEYGVPAIFFICSGHTGGEGLFWYDELKLRLLEWQDRDIHLPDRPEYRLWPKGELGRAAVSKCILSGCKKLSNEARLEYIDYLRRLTPTWRPEETDRELVQPMSWDDVVALSNRGFEIGSHTVEHPLLSKLTIAALRHELKDSKARIEEMTKKPCFAIAYPNGTVDDITPTVIAETEAAGYELGFVVGDRLHRRTSSRFLISRVGGIGHSPLGATRMRVSGLYSFAQKMNLARARATEKTLSVPTHNILGSPPAGPHFLTRS